MFGIQESNRNLLYPENFVTGAECIDNGAATIGGSEINITFGNVKWDTGSGCLDYPTIYAYVVQPGTGGLYSIYCSSYVSGTGSTSATNPRRVKVFSEQLGELGGADIQPEGAGDSITCFTDQVVLSDRDRIFVKVFQGSGTNKTVTIDGVTAHFSIVRLGDVSP